MRFKIKVYAKDEQIRNTILDWMIEQLSTEGEVSLHDLIRQYNDKVVIEDDDILSYWDVGWNVLDLLKLSKAKFDLNNLEIPGPKCRFWKYYT